MPITIGIPGGGSPGYVTNIYSVTRALDITRSPKTVADRALVITNSVPRKNGLRALDVQKDVTFEFLSSIRIGRISKFESIRSLEVISGDSFLILADLIQQELSPSALLSSETGYININAKLLIDDEEVGIKAFQFQAPTGGLGKILNVQLADGQTRSQVPVGSSVDFQLIINDSIPFTLMSTGKLQERDIRVAFRGGKNFGPIDEITFGALDVMADKFTLGPRRPVIMYDPSRVKQDELRVDRENAIREENGTLVFPVIEPSYGLSMKKIIQRAYTGIGGHALTTSAPSLGGFVWSTNLSSAGNDQVGCGFDTIITNIEDYKIKRADFSIESGWHDGARPSVEMYTPIYFVEGSTLFIIDPDKELPYGTSPRIIYLDQHKALSERAQYKPDVNAVLLTYQYAKGDPSEDPTKQVREVFFDDEPVETGTPGSPGYSVSSTRRWVREWFFSDNPTEVIDTQPKSTETTTQIIVVYVDIDGNPTGPSFLRTSNVETIDYTYEGEFCTGWTRTVQAMVANPASAFLMSLVTIETETCEISWEDDPYNPGIKIQSRNVLSVVGKTYIDPDSTEDVIDSGNSISFSRQYPVLVAQAAGVVKESWIIRNEVPIKTVSQTLRHKGGTQYDVEVIEVDHLNNTLRRSYTDPVSGGHPTNDGYESRSRTTIIRNTASEAEIGTRIPITVNAFELPRKRALALGHRVLDRLQNPLQLMPIDLPFPDLALERGSVIKGERRPGDGYTGIYFVTGYSYTGENLGKVGHRIFQNLETIELLST